MSVRTTTGLSSRWPTHSDVLCPGRDDDSGFQLYHSDPSGNYGGWKATAIGQNHQAAQNILKTDYKEEVTLEEAVQLVIKVCCCCCTLADIQWHFACCKIVT